MSKQEKLKLPIASVYWISTDAAGYLFRQRTGPIRQLADWGFNCKASSI
jgi:hypothetical protein